MSPGGRTEHVTHLRAIIARIENGTPAMAALSSGGTRATTYRRPYRPITGRLPVLPLGQPGFALDRLLGGGLRQGTLHEIVPGCPKDEGAASGFALALAARCLRATGTLVWIVDDCAASESGAPYRPGLLAHGLDPDRLIVVRTKGAQATLWAAEEALRAGAFLVLAELWGGRFYGLVPSRRLVLAARANGATGLLLHAGLSGGARVLSSSSETRFVVAAMPSRRMAGASFGPLPVPGGTAFALRLDKARSAACAVDRHHTYSLLWNVEQRCFHDADLPVALAAASFDGPAAASYALP